MRSRIPVVALVSLVGVLASSAALAEGKAGHAGRSKDGIRRGERIAFPIPADRFEVIVERQVDRAKAKIEKKAEKLPPEKKTALERAVASAEAAVDAAEKQAVADGSVTADEARKVREAVAALQRQARAAIGLPAKPLPRPAKAKPIERPKNAS